MQCAVFVIVAVVVSGLANAQEGADKHRVYNINLPAQSVAESLTGLSQQTNQMLLFSYDEVEGLIASPVFGKYTIPEALNITLQGTGYSGSLTKKGVLMISVTKSEAVNKTEENESMNTKKQILASVVSVFVSGGLQMALAEDGIEGKQIRGLEEIVVTAQRREERLQDVPISMEVLGAEQLANHNVQDLTDLKATVPGLTISGFGGINASNLVAIRGVVGQPLPVGSGHPTAMYLDGVYLSRPDAAFFELDDVERIEVLRGPQGTLYGRNATAGAINIVTRDPGDNMEGSLGLNYGNYDAMSVRGSLRGPISGNLSGGMSLSYSGHDGYLDNTVTKNPAEDVEKYTVRGKLRYTSSDEAFTAMLSADYSSVSGTGFLFENPYQGNVFVGLGDPDKVANSDDDDFRSRSRGTALTMTWRVSDALELTSITSARKINISTIFDYDGTLSSRRLAASKNSSDTFSQEIRALYTTDRLRTTLGANYFREEADFTWSPVYPITYNNPSDTTELDAYALFAQVEFDLTDKLTVVGGLRYNNESRDFTIDYTKAPVPGSLIQGKIDDNVLIPSIGINYNPTEDILIYVKASQGYLAPGFNPLPGPAGVNTFDPETLWAYEAGLKSQFIDRRLTMNLAVFSYDYQDIQVRSLLSPGIFGIDNAASATVEGAELSLIGIITNALTLTLGVTYADSAYDDFCQAINPGTPQGSDSLCGVGLADRSGNKLSFAPEWSGNVGLEYRIPLDTGGEFSARVDYTWESTIYFTTTNEPFGASSGGWEKINARLSYELNNGLELYAYGKNLMDDRYTALGIRNNATAIPTMISEPRTYGVGLRYSF